MTPETPPRSAAALIRLLAAIALLTLAIVPAWGVRHIDLDGLAAGETLPAPKLLLSSVHL
ncbi:MAG: hypothetical protein QOH04_590 [Sphingomonadales bacterium]|jgi:hypothetical protein|nr:hypothetical protein [Sphingomonadales bacterium]MEA3034831.1 hypothetical protein [Sphingomonadales bacterium]